jgi:hypothetical protein
MLRLKAASLHINFAFYWKHLESLLINLNPCSKGPTLSQGVFVFFKCVPEFVFAQFERISNCGLFALSKMNEAWRKSWLV